jgi:hypothetical protein
MPLGLSLNRPPTRRQFGHVNGNVGNKIRPVVFLDH